jgi:hypothetical protein
MSLRWRAVTFSATCIHCDHPVFKDQPQIGSAEVHSLQHHLLRRCRPDEALIEDVVKLLMNFRVVMAD